MWPTKSEELWKAVVERSEARDSKKPTKLNEDKQKKSENENPPTAEAPPPAEGGADHSCLPSLILPPAPAV